MSSAVLFLGRDIAVQCIRTRAALGACRASAAFVVLSNQQCLVSGAGRARKVLPFRKWSLHRAAQSGIQSSKSTDASFGSTQIIVGPRLCLAGVLNAGETPPRARTGALENRPSRERTTSARGAAAAAQWDKSAPAVLASEAVGGDGAAWPMSRTASSCQAGGGGSTKRALPHTLRQTRSRPDGGRHHEAKRAPPQESNDGLVASAKIESSVQSAGAANSYTCPGEPPLSGSPSSFGPVSGNALNLSAVAASSSSPAKDTLRAGPGVRTPYESFLSPDFWPLSFRPVGNCPKTASGACVRAMPFFCSIHTGASPSASSVSPPPSFSSFPQHPSPSAVGAAVTAALSPPAAAALQKVREALVVNKPKATANFAKKDLKNVEGNIGKMKRNLGRPEFHNVKLNKDGHIFEPTDKFQIVITSSKNNVHAVVRGKSMHCL
eukprot:GHVT01105057.1.p1 GENE.GHVT01105057.1~~GHVT01105057.1.p1  ORF type:complete len:436 (+),score=90.41 GHVT01105057.1:314-1621(+)